MAKIKHNNFLDTVNEVFTDAKQEGILHLYAEGSSFSGRTIGIGDRELFHFGTTGYLGLEQDIRLKRAAADAIMAYGTQFPLSKSYVSHPLYGQLEQKVTQMYGSPIIITKNSTLGHLGVIPSAVSDRDAIILDHQVHWSVQSASKVLKNRSVPIDMVRHNDLNMLEDKIKSHSNKRERVWYMADGIYSMYGDYAPISDLMALCNRYPQLSLYIDDVHGMGWSGRNGTGHTLSELGELPDNVLLFGTLSKTFGASGAVLACADKKMHNKIRTFGGPLTFSAQLEPASVAAAIASADIHLSPEIYDLQNDLRERIKYFNGLLGATDLPLVDHNDSPVFYIGTGMPKTGYNFVNRLMKEDYYVNLGLFPAVPVKNTGVRITISRHNQKKEIKGLVEAMAYHFPKALADTGTTPQRVFHAFKLKPKSEAGTLDTHGLSVTLETSIQNIDRETWNRCMGRRGVFDWDGLKFLEKSFSDNGQKEHDWKFWYLIIYGHDRTPVLATYLTLSLWKDDMLAPPKLSTEIEVLRKDDPYHMTSRVLAMGSLFTEGDHLFLDASTPLRDKALDILVQQLEHLEKRHGAKMVVLRDFAEKDALHGHFQGQGFVRVQMPDSCSVHLEKGISIGGYIGQLSARNRRHFRKDIMSRLPLTQVEIIESPNPAQLERIRELYNNVHENNLGLNTFAFPAKLFDNMAAHPQWEFIAIAPKERPKQIIGAMLCYKNGRHTYIPAFVGLDYGCNEAYGTYRQLLYRTIERAIALKFEQIDLGMTAAFEKRKLGALVEGRYAYLQTADNYILERLGVLEGR
ncbi:aminotransferase class I/II-fold pyridoxal phosphate-dependent enzyme [Flavisericum labens]|uniref:aminotransferase class I/II-fold pyridoxal phosphate-dependent enzyme n=1 Tax=Flavisericum labens TaxID=3377112 RepID=UPI00387ABECE